MHLRTFLLGALVITIGATTASAQTDKPVDPKKLERLLSELEKHVRRMLEMQNAVQAETIKLHKAIESNKDKKPSPKDLEAAQKLALKQNEIASLATKIVEMLNADASVAFTEVFEQLRDDSRRVQKRLAAGDVGKATQTLIADDIIEILRELVSSSSRR